MSAVVGKIDIPDDAWEENGSDDTPWGRLNAQVVICGVTMHLEAIAVGNRNDRDADDYVPQFVLDEAFADNLEHYFDAQFVCEFQTANIRGRDYVLIATPHAD